MQERTVVCGGESYLYFFEAKKVKNFNMRVHRDGSLHVSAPRRASLAAVDAFVLSHVPFIVRAREKMRRAEEKQPTELSDGCTVFFCGERYRLFVKEGRESLSFADGVAVLTVKDKTSASAVCRAWENCAKKAFFPIIEAMCHAREADFAALGIAPPTEIRLRKMTSMWGNCRSKSGVLTFSTMLAEVPRALVDYVVCHEFCHLKHPDHSARFYALLRRVCPDYAEKRKTLKERTWIK